MLNTISGENFLSTTYFTNYLKKRNPPTVASSRNLLMIEIILILAMDGES